MRGQIECERAAVAQLALDAHFATKQTRNFAADRQPETRTAEFAGRRCIRLLERLEDQPLLLLRDADARVPHAECNYIARLLQLRIHVMAESGAVDAQT